MKNISFFFIFLLHFLSSPIAIGQDMEASAKILLTNSTKYHIIGDIDGVVMALFDNNGRYKIRGFDETMNEKWEKKIEFEKKTARIVGIVSSKKNISVFYKYKKKGRVHLRMREFNNELKMIDSCLVKLYSRRTFSPNPVLHYSKNKKKMMFLSAKDEKIIDIVSFDMTTKKKIIDIVLQPKRFEYRTDFLDVVVSNKGAVHLIAHKDNKRSKREKSRLELISISEDKQYRTYAISLKNNLWYDIDFSYDNINNRLLLSGFYSHKTTTTGHGVFYGSIDLTNEKEQTLTFTPFDKKYLSLLLGKNIKKNVGFGDVDVQQILPRRDGGLLLIAERNQQYIRGYNDGSLSARDLGDNTQIDYFFNEILLFSFHPSGEIHWKEILHKKQYSNDDKAAFSSYFLFQNSSNLRLLYNDKVQKGGSVFEYTVSVKGELDRKSLFNTEKEKLMLRIRDAVQTSIKTIIVPSERRNFVRFIKLTF